MRTFYIFLFLAVGLFFSGCAEDEVVRPVSELEGEKASVTSLTVEVFDREATQHETGSCEGGSGTDRNRIIIRDAAVRLYYKEADFTNRNSPERVGNTGSSGTVDFTNLVADRYFVYVSTGKGEISQMVNTPKGKHSIVAIGL